MKHYLLILKRNAGMKYGALRREDRGSSLAQTKRDETEYQEQ